MLSREVTQLRVLFFLTTLSLFCSVRISAQDVVLEGHEGAVTQARFFANASFAITTSADTSVRIWDAAQGREIRRFTEHTGPVYSLDISSDGRFAVSGGQDNTVRIWDLPDARPAEHINSSGTQSSVRLISKNGGTLYFTQGSQLAEISLRDFASSSRAEPLTLKRYPFSESKIINLVESRDGTLLAGGSSNGQIQIWSPFLKKSLAVFDATDAPIRNLWFGSTAGTIISADVTGVIKVWQVTALLAGNSSPEGTKKPEAPVPTLVREFGIATDSCLAIVPLGTGSQFAAVGQNGTITTYDANTGKQIRTIAENLGTVNCLAVRPDGQRIAAASAEGVSVWNTATSEVIAQLNMQDAVELVWSHDGRTLLTCGTQRVEIFGPSLPGKPAQELVSHQLIMPGAKIESGMFSKDNRSFWLGTVGGEVVRWRYSSPVQQRQLAHSGAVYGVAITPDGRSLVTCGADQTVRVWELSSGRQKFQMRGHSGAIHSVSVNDVGTQALTTGADGTVRLWDIVGGRQLKQLAKFDATMYSSALIGGGSHAVVGGADSVIRLIDVATGDITKELVGHSDYVHCLRLNADRSRLLSYGYAGQTHLWDLKEGQSVASGQIGRIGNSADISPDQLRILLASGDGSVRITNLPK